MKRTIGLLAALVLGGCGVEAADLISVQSATMRYDTRNSAGLERHEVALTLSQAADERIACIRVRCTSGTGSEEGTVLCVDTARSTEAAFGLYASERCASAAGVLTHEDGTEEPFPVVVR